MQITIAGHRRASEILENNPKELDVIFISSPDATYAVQGSSKIEGLAKNCCKLLFHDISMPRGDMSPPKKEDVKKALDFAKGKEKLLVCCQAGISRSSAIAYLIAAAEVGPKEAFSVLNPEVHQPNSLIVRHGAFILGEPDMMDMMDHWKTAADEAQWDTGPELLNF